MCKKKATHGHKLLQYLVLDVLVMTQHSLKKSSFCTVILVSSLVPMKGSFLS